MTRQQFFAASDAEKSAFRFAHIGHWLGFFTAQIALGVDRLVASNASDLALHELLYRVPQLAQPAEIEPHGAPDFSQTNTKQKTEAAPDGPIVNEESASSPRQHPAAISKLVEAARDAAALLDDTHHDQAVS